MQSIVFITAGHQDSSNKLLLFYTKARGLIYLTIACNIWMIRRSCILQITWRRNILPTGNIPFAIHESLNFVMFLKTARHHRFILMSRRTETLVNLRISNHKRNIETGRYDKISKCDRICPVCGLNIEDEIHFLFDSQNIHQLETTFLIK